MENENKNELSLFKGFGISTERICYSKHKARIPLVCSLEFSNETESPVGGTLCFFSEPEDFIKPDRIEVPKFKGEKIIKYAFTLNPACLSKITENVEANIVVSFENEDRQETLRKEVEILPYNYWSGSPIEMPVFVTPNVQEIEKLTFTVGQKMEKRGQNSILNGYEQNDPKRIELFCAAVYDTLRDLKLTYSLPPERFEEIGQPIRMVDSIISSHTATCIDSTLLFASVLEALHLHPFIILIPGHTFVGCWLNETLPDEPISGDGAMIVNKLLSSKRQVCVIETTAIALGKDFQEACKKAENTAEAYKDSMIIVDIASCRYLKIRPISMDRYAENGSVNLVDDKENMSKLDLDSNDYTAEEEINLEFKKETDKVVYWSKKLLDLSTRNVLINLNPNRKKLITILNTDLGKLEDKLSQFTELSFKQSPFPQQIQDFMVTPLKEEGIKQIIDESFAKNTILANMDEKELLSRLKGIMNQAHSDLIETGANTLFLGIGILNWYEGPISRFAPLILMPVELKRLSAKNYKLKRRDEDCILNYSIIEKIKQDYQVNVPYDNQNLPLDEAGVDIDKVFRTISKCIEKLTNWSVLPYSVLGIFSFSQFIIYNDLLSRKKEFESHPIVNSLIKNELQFEYVPIPEVSDDDLRKMVLPVSCDESQLRAVKAANEGCSFVLQGPPGTGKSQTITSIIADSLTHGKTVLFVAEKRAALEVVERNLNKIGLKDFVLELHSTKATKEHIIGQFDDAILNKIKTKRTQYSSLTEDLINRRKKLNAVISEINTERINGLSLYDLICQEIDKEKKSSCKLNVDPDFDFSISEMDKNNAIEALMRYSKLVAPFAPLSENPNFALYKELGKTESLSKTKEEIETFIQISKQRNQVIGELVNSYSFLVNIANQPEILANLNELIKIAQGFDLPSFAVQGNIKILAPKLMRIKETQAKIEGAKQGVSVKFDPGIFEVKVLEELVKLSRSLLQAGFFQRGGIQKQLVNTLQSFTSQKIEKTQAPAIVDTLTPVLMAMQELEKAKEGVPFEILEISDDVFITKLISYDNCLTQILSLSDDISLAMASMLVKNTQIGDLLDEIISCTTKLKEYTNPLFKKTFSQLENIITRIDSIKDLDYQRLSLCVEEREAIIRQTHATEFVRAIENNELDALSITDDFELSYSRALCQKIIRESEQLKLYDSSINQFSIDEYRKREDEYAQTSKTQMLNCLLNNKPDSDISFGQMAHIKRAIANKGRGVSIREFFTKIPDFYSRFFPCFLMSPLSVAQYLDPSLSAFDVVIFDEASQLTTSKAIGAISRGKQVIVVGDTKQMPPTSFFQKKETNEDLMTNYDFEVDLESILNDVIAINMPEILLSWHYRSKHESLIQFSNENYYQNRLKTYPSTDAYTSHVKFVKVEGFYYPKSQEPNPEEVKAIISEVKRRLEDAKLSKKSIGIITFNERQQNAISERLDSFFEAYPDLAKISHWFDTSDDFADTRLFVKNIENVQGDERDVVLFSTCFGPTEDNPSKIELRFGPIQQAGGERRLNVAFSRAKEEMVIFSIMNPNDLSKRDLKSKGLRDLSAFLQYAASHSTNNIDDEEDEVDQIKKKIGTFLEQNGHKISYDIGDSSFKVDIGLFSPDGITFEVGVVLDGPVSYSAKTSRDREVLRQDFLKIRGWKVVKTSVIDWYLEPARAQDKLLSDIKNILIAPEPEVEPQAQVEPQPEPEPEPEQTYEVRESSYAEMAYEEPIVKIGLEAGAVIHNSQAKISQMAKQLINDYGPISEKKLKKTILKEFGLSRTGSAIGAIFDSVFKEITDQGYECKAQIITFSTSPDPEIEPYYWPIDLSSSSYRFFRRSTVAERPIDEVPFEEMINYLLFKLERCFVLDKEDVYSVIQEGFGSKARTERFKTVVDAALKVAIKRKYLIQREDGRLEAATKA